MLAKSLWKVEPFLLLVRVFSLPAGGKAEQHGVHLINQRLWSFAVYSFGVLNSA